MNDEELNKLAETLDTGGKSLIEGNPEDKGIGKYGMAPAVKDENRQIQESLRTLVETDKAKIGYAIGKELLSRIEKGKLSKERLTDLAKVLERMVPPKEESNKEETQNFMQWVLKVTAERKKYEIIDVEK